MNKFSSKCLGFLSQKTCHWSSVELWVVFHFFVCKIEKNFHPVWNSNAGVWVGLIVNVIIPWGKNKISEEFGEVLLPFSSWGLSLRISGGYPEDALIEHHQVMLPSSCTSPLQHKMLPHFTPPAESLICWGAGERMWHGCGCMTPGRTPGFAVLFQPWVDLPIKCLVLPCGMSLVPCGSLKEGQKSILWGTVSKSLPIQGVNIIRIF